MKNSQVQEITASLHQVMRRKSNVEAKLKRLGEKRAPLNEELGKLMQEARELKKSLIKAACGESEDEHLVIFI